MENPPSPRYLPNGGEGEDRIPGATCLPTGTTGGQARSDKRRLDSRLRGNDGGGAGMTEKER